jgi:hypothetical protein
MTRKPTGLLVRANEGAKTAIHNLGFSTLLLHAVIVRSTIQSIYWIFSFSGSAHQPISTPRPERR